MISRMKLPIPVVSAVFAALAAVAVPARAAEIVFGITSGTALSLPHYIAEEQQYYAAENLAVTTYVVGAAAGVLQQFAGGSLNMAQAATDQTLRAILRGAPIRIVAGAAANAPFRVVAARNLKSFGDLKGRTVSVGGLTDVTLYFLRVMARKNGLADRDYDLLYGGGSPSRLAQLFSGAVAATVLTNPQDFTALERGYVDLGSVTQYLPHWAQNNLLVDTRWAATHREAVTAFLRAQVKAARYFYDPANRDDVIAILVKRTKTTPEVASATYALYIRDEVIAREAALSEAGIRANLDAFVEMHERTDVPAVAGFLDTSFLGEVVQTRSVR
jgi:NitT/TauT family transport system substrate-binding protein